ncbi:MAG TPA: hypothetical protein VGG03_15950 [Thermoanaerobaculia bacterium]|jgi:hypothetical protein
MKKLLMLTCLTLLASVSLVGAQEVTPDRATPSQKARLQEMLMADPSWADGKEDPPGVLNNVKIDSVRQLALRLSANRDWLRNDVLKTLDKMGVRVNEIFAEAPGFVEVDQNLYRLVLEKVGSGWEGFNPRSSPYLIFLDHETFDGYGENFALAFENGKERMIVEEDLQKVAAIGLSLSDITPDERPEKRAGVVGIDQPIRLGKVVPRFRLTNPIDIGGIVNRKDSCLPESAPTSCSGGVPVCSSPNASPYFVLSSLLIKKDHEDAFSGDPGIELYPLRVNPYSPYGGSSDVRTNWIFDGRTVTDLMGRSRYLPDVDNNYTWYSISGGLALFPSRVSNEWAATLIEDDDTKGRLKIDRNKYNPVKKRDTLIDFFPFDLFDHLVSTAIDYANLILTLGILNDSDDLYLQSIEVSNATFCSEALGQYFPYTLTFDSSEWGLRGYFACIDPTCVPPPPDDPCNGSYCCGRPGCIEP